MRIDRFAVLDGLILTDVGGSLCLSVLDSVNLPIEHEHDNAEQTAEREHLEHLANYRQV